MPSLNRIAFRASPAPAAQNAFARLVQAYGQTQLDGADVVVALGGDGFMLQTLHDLEGIDLPVYGMNCGTIGFLMNTCGDDFPDEYVREHGVGLRVEQHGHGLM